MLLQEILPYANNWNVKSYFHDKGVTRHLFMTTGRRSSRVLLTTGELSKNVVPRAGGCRLGPSPAAQTGPMATAGRRGGNGQVRGQ